MPAKSVFHMKHPHITDIDTGNLQLDRGKTRKMQGIFKANLIGDPAYILCEKCMYPVYVSVLSLRPD